MNNKIKSIYISNFKAYNDKNIPLVNKNSIFIGENDSGKSSILEVLNYFFNEKQIPIEYVRDISKEVIIGIYINNTFYKKVFNGKSFKLDEKKSDNSSTLSTISYIYIGLENNTIDNIIKEFSIAKIKSKIQGELENKINEISKEAVSEVINSIDENLLVINSEEKLIFKSEVNMKIDKSSFPISIKNQGVSLIARGSGFRRNILFSILTNNDYNNVILGIDEIENSFSINSVSLLLQKLSTLFNQTLITTHSKTVLTAISSFQVIPIFSNNITTIAELLLLEPTDKKTTLLIEGITDINWVIKSLEFLNLSDKYQVIPVGGAQNVQQLSEIFKANATLHSIIVDGDNQGKLSKFKLSKDIIEQYIPLEELNKLFNTNLSSVPEKKDFFQKLGVKDNNKQKSQIKHKISDWVINGLTKENPIVNEIKNILELQN